MAEESVPEDGASVTSMSQDAAILMSDHPQEFHYEKLAEGIEELEPGLVVLRKMGDIQALTRSKAVRQFGEARRPTRSAAVRERASDWAAIMWRYHSS